MRHFWPVRFLLSNWAGMVLNQKTGVRFRPSPQKREFLCLGEPLGNSRSLSAKALAASGREYSLAAEGLRSPSVSSAHKAPNALPFALSCLLNGELVA